MEMSKEDLMRDFVGCIVMYKGLPVYINDVQDGCNKVVYTELQTDKVCRIDFKLTDFINPLNRLGFMNVGRFALYVYRSPIRRYYMGLTTRNTSVSRIVETSDREFIKAKSLAIPEMANTLLRIYPTLAEAWAKVSSVGGSCAFDRQFAITADRRIFYKTDVVGVFENNQIQWRNGKEHLTILLDNNHEKDLRNFRTSLK